MQFDIDMGEGRMLKLSPDGLAEAYNRIQDRCLQIANDFARIMSETLGARAGKFDMWTEIGGKRFRLRERFGYDKEFDAIEHISPSEFSCSFEYNTECSCHPRYEKFTQSFPTTLLCIDDPEELEKELARQAALLRDQWDQERK